MNFNENQSVNLIRLIFCATNDDLIKALILKLGEESEHQIINNISNSCWGDDIQNFDDADRVRKAIIKECDFVVDKRQQKRRKNKNRKRDQKFTKWYANEGKKLIQEIKDEEY